MGRRAPRAGGAVVVIQKRARNLEFGILGGRLGCRCWRYRLGQRRRAVVSERRDLEVDCSANGDAAGPSGSSHPGRHLRTARRIKDPTPDLAKADLVCVWEDSRKDKTPNMAKCIPIIRLVSAGGKLQEHNIKILFHAGVCGEWESDLLQGRWSRWVCPKSSPRFYCTKFQK